MAMMQENNRQYYEGAQSFVSAAGANQLFTTTFDTDLIFGNWNPANADYALNNFKVYTSANGLPGTYTEYLLAYTVVNNVIDNSYFSYRNLCCCAIKSFNRRQVWSNRSI